MKAYGILLKQLLSLSNSKLTSLAEVIGYDVSYISKWCNKDFLPSAKAAGTIHRAMSAYFAGEILKIDAAADFAEEFQLPPARDSEALEKQILNLLKNAYRQSQAPRPASDSTPEPQAAAAAPGVPVFMTDARQISLFFTETLPGLLRADRRHHTILTTLDILHFLSLSYFEKLPAAPAEGGLTIKAAVRIPEDGEDRERLSYLPKLYYLVNHYQHVSFSFYDNQELSDLNLILIDGMMTILCSLDDRKQLTAISITESQEMTDELFQRISPLFRSAALLAHASDSANLVRNGYRTQFYSHGSFRILLTRGFEFLLPPEITPKLIAAADKQGLPDSTGAMIRHLQITWEELFEKVPIDFFVLKSSLMKYVTDGIMFFADVRFYMTPEDRRLQIRHVLETLKRNPEIRFHVIDDDYLGLGLLRSSIFSNGHQLFLKNTENYESESGRGPVFYTVESSRMITEIDQYLDLLKENPYCKTYDAPAVYSFYETYGNLVDRLMSI